MFGSVCLLSAFVEPTLCTTSTVQSYVVHHRPALCTTDLLCAACCTRVTYFFLRSRGHPLPIFFLVLVVHVEHADADLVH